MRGGSESEVTAKRCVTKRIAKWRFLMLSSLACASGSPRPTEHLQHVCSPTHTAALTERETLGRRLFEDVRLSRDSSLSCATCHSPFSAFAEARRVSHGIGEGARRRNAPSLLNAWVFRKTFDWDGRAASLEHQLRFVFSRIGDMGLELADVIARVRTDTMYESAFRSVYSRPADEEALLDALVAFERTLLIVGSSRFERFYFGGEPTAFTESEARGWQLFRTSRAGCSGCHVPLPDPDGSGAPVFHDNRFHNLGVGYRDGVMTDLGRFEATGVPTDWGAFRTPSLSNISLTAPYMHDGSLATLEDVVEFYAQGGIPNPNLDPVVKPVVFSKQERDDLVAFLRTLTADWLADTSAVRSRILGAVAVAGFRAQNTQVGSSRGVARCLQ